MTPKEKQKLILNHELDMMRMRMEHQYKMKKMEIEHQQKLNELKHKLDMMGMGMGWLGKLFGR